MFRFADVDVRKYGHIMVLLLSEGSFDARCLCLFGRGNTSRWSSAHIRFFVTFRPGMSGGGLALREAKGSGLPLVFGCVL